MYSRDKCKYKKLTHKSKSTFSSDSDNWNLSNFLVLFVESSKRGRAKMASSESKKWITNKSI